MPRTPPASRFPRGGPVLALLAALAICLAGSAQAQSDDGPTVSIDEPAEGATVNGTVEVAGTASAPNGSVDKVEVRIDGGAWENATGTGNWSYAWDTTNESEGEHAVDARSWSGNNSSTVDTVNVTVDNEDPNEPPTVSIDHPAEGATVNGTVEVAGNASDPDGNVTSVEVRVDGGAWETASGTSSWTYSWDTTGLADGQHTLEARAHDGNTSSTVDAVNVTVDNPNQAPSVSFDHPAEGATVSGSVDVAGSASDPDGSVEAVEVQVDGGGWQAADGTGSWTWTWDTTGVADGEHTLEARAWDGSTYSTVAQRNVTVDNTQDDGGSTDPNQSPSITIDRPAEGATVEGSVTIEGRAWDGDGQVTRVEVQVDGGAWETAGGTGAWGYPWDTDQVDEGEHTITARAFDDDGDWNTAWTTVTVNRTSNDSGGDDGGNDTAPNEPPELTVLEPRDNATVSGEVLLSGTANDPEGELDKLELRLDDWGWRTRNASTSWVERWNMSTVPEGEHLLSVRVTDADGATDVVLRRIHVAPPGGAALEASSGEDSQLEAANASSAPNEEPPSVELTGTSTVTTDGQTQLVIEGVATDPDDPETLVVEYRVDGGDWQAFEATPGEPFEHAVPAGDLSPGEHDVELRASDGVHLSDAETSSFEAPGASGSVMGLAAVVIGVLAGGGLLFWVRHTNAAR